jgi:hypothetical protein
LVCAYSFSRLAQPGGATAAAPSSAQYAKYGVAPVAGFANPM